jgi:hypothetical protein
LVYMEPDLRRNRQVRVDEIAVQKGGPRFQAMRRDGFVGPKYIKCMYLSQ